ncbi:MAG: cation:proton antiporter [Acidimicrobiia bacterium]
MSLDVLNLLLILLAALIGGRIAQRFGYPAILGELGAGILLGPPLLGVLDADDALAVIGKLGVVLLMLYIGLHLNPGDIGKASGAGALAAFGGFVVPAALGFGLMMIVTGDPIASTFVAVAMGVTSLATKSRILVDLGILNTRIAHVLMAGALFSDIAALIIFAAILGLAATGAFAVGGIALAAAKAALFLAGAWFVGSKVFPIVGERIAKRTNDTSILLLGTVIAGLLFAAAADAAGLHAILGAFLAGLFIRDGVLPHKELKDVEHRLKGVSVGLIAPVFFVTAGFNVSFDVFTEAPLLLAAVIVVATVGKILGTAIFYLPTGYGFREGLAVGAGMNGRGAVEIIVAEIALAAGLIDATVFSILVFMAIFTTATVPILLTIAIKSLREHGELVADEREGIVIVGASPIARQLAHMLGDRDVTLVDNNADYCAEASAEGLEVVKGNGLDIDVLEEAGAAKAETLIGATANGEVNLITARLGSTRFGVPNVLAALPPTTTNGMVEVLDEFGGEMLFGRTVDIANWNTDIERGSVSELSYTVEEPDDVIADGVPQASQASTVESLSMVVATGTEARPFTQSSDLSAPSRVIALGREVNAIPPDHELIGSQD